MPISANLSKTPVEVPFLGRQSFFQWINVSQVRARFSQIFRKPTGASLDPPMYTIFTLTFPSETDMTIFLGKSKAAANIEDEKYLNDVNIFINIMIWLVLVFQVFRFTKMHPKLWKNSMMYLILDTQYCSYHIVTCKQWQFLKLRH